MPQASVTKRHGFVLYSQIGHQQSESLLPLNPESDGPAPATETSSSCRTLEEGGSAVQPEAGPHAGPSEEPEEGAELARVVLGGSPAAPEQALPTAAPAAPGPQDRPEAAPSLRTLEQVGEPSGGSEEREPLLAWRSLCAESVLRANARALHGPCARFPGRLLQRAVCCLRVLEACGPDRGVGGCEGPAGQASPPAAARIWLASRSGACGSVAPSSASVLTGCVPVYESMSRFPLCLRTPVRME